VSTCTTWGGRIPTEPEILAVRMSVIPCLASNMLTWDGPPPGQPMWSSTESPGGNPMVHDCVYFDGTPAVPTPDANTHWVRCVK
jgi:hypothetical protein